MIPPSVACWWSPNCCFDDCGMWEIDRQRSFAFIPQSWLFHGFEFKWNSASDCLVAFLGIPTFTQDSSSKPFFRSHLPLPRRGESNARNTVQTAMSAWDSPFERRSSLRTLVSWIERPNYVTSFDDRLDSHPMIHSSRVRRWVVIRSTFMPICESVTSYFDLLVLLFLAKVHHPDQSRSYDLGTSISSSPKRHHQPWTSLLTARPGPTPYHQASFFVAVDEANWLMYTVLADCWWQEPNVGFPIRGNSLRLVSEGSRVRLECRYL